MGTEELRTLKEKREALQLKTERIYRDAAMKYYAKIESEDDFELPDEEFDKINIQLCDTFKAFNSRNEDIVNRFFEIDDDQSRDEADKEKEKISLLEDLLQDPTYLCLCK